MHVAGVIDMTYRENNAYNVLHVGEFDFLWFWRDMYLVSGLPSEVIFVFRRAVQQNAREEIEWRRNACNDVTATAATSTTCTK